MSYEVECDQCDGSGKNGNPLYELDCSNCNGKGYIEKLEHWELEEEEYMQREIDEAEEKRRLDDREIGKEIY